MIRQHTHANEPERFCNRFDNRKPALWYATGRVARIVFGAIYVGALIGMLCLVLAP